MAREGAANAPGTEETARAASVARFRLEHEFHMLLTVRALHGRLLENAFARGIDKGKDGVQRHHAPVSYTHLTLPTIRLV